MARMQKTGPGPASSHHINPEISPHAPARYPDESRMYEFLLLQAAMFLCWSLGGLGTKTLASIDKIYWDVQGLLIGIGVQLCDLRKSYCEKLEVEAA